jgi:hypothetical protein
MKEALARKIVCEWLHGQIADFVYVQELDLDHFERGEERTVQVDGDLNFSKLVDRLVKDSK